MEFLKTKSPLIRQIFSVSGVLCTMFSCGLGLGHLAFLDSHKQISEEWRYYIETAGEVAFVPSILIIPLIMQNKGRKVAGMLTTLPLLFGWIINFDSTGRISLLIVNILRNIALGGVVTIGSVIISEYCSSRYRATLLLLETAVMSFGVLISHVCSLLTWCRVTTVLGTVFAFLSVVITYLLPESPYWLISQGYMVMGSETFQWLRGKDEDAVKELEDFLMIYKLKLQNNSLKPIRNLRLKDKAKQYLQSLLKADFMKPLSIMILLFSFVGLGGENFLSNYPIRDIFHLTNRKYFGTIILDVFTLGCSITACLLVNTMKRKSLFIFTSCLSILFLSLAALFLLVQTLQMFSLDYMWLYLSLVTGFVMFMSLGTTALPFSLLGEIFPMSYKGIGSSLTCAYLWAFGKSFIKLAPISMQYLGLHGMLFLSAFLMIVIVIVLNKIMPETHTKTLIEIDRLMKLDHVNVEYENVTIDENDDIEHFDKLQLFIDV